MDDINLMNMNMLSKFKFRVQCSLSKNLINCSYGYGNYDPKKGCIITIMPGFYSYEEQFDLPKKYDHIFMLSTSNTFIKGSPYVIAQSTEKTGLQEQKLQLSELSVDNFPFDTQFNPNTLNIGFSGLNHWLPMNDVSFPKTMGLIINASPCQEVGKFLFKNQEYTLNIGHREFQHSPHSDKRLFEFSIESFFTVRSSSKIKDNEAVQLGNHLSELFEIMVIPSNLNYLCLQDNNFAREFFIRQSRKIFHYPSNLIARQCLLTFSEIKNQLAKIVDNYLNANNSLKFLVDDYLLTINFDTVVENNLINLTQGIESFYKDQKNDKNQPMNLLEKLTAMVNELPDEFINILKRNVGDVETWLKRIKNTRVYLTHGNKRNNCIEDPNEIIYAVNVFQFLVRIFILSKLGINISTKNIIDKFELIFQINFY